MNRELLLSILYDISLTIGSEISLKPLLTNTLQRLMLHTGSPCGILLLGNREDGYRIKTAIGDSVAIDACGDQLSLPDELCAGVARHEYAMISGLPCRQEKYSSLIHFTIPGEGVILLLFSAPFTSDMPLEQMFPPVLSQLAKSIALCRASDQQKHELEQKVAERTARLQQSEQQIRLILESTAEGIFGLDMEGSCIFANAAALSLLGFDDAQELVGGKIHDLIHHTRVDGSEYPLHECRIVAATQKGESIYVSDEIFWRKDGTSFPVEYRSLPIREDDTNIGQVITFSDITERLQQEQEKQETQRKLEHTQRLESLGVMAGGIAHDFNNLLTAIMGNAVLAQKNMSPESEAYSLIEHVNHASQSAANLCRQMLAYSGKGKFTLEPINLSQLVETMSELMGVSISKQAQLFFDLDPEIPLIEGDIAQFQQIIMNLITNANESLEGQTGIIRITTGSINVSKGYLKSMNIDDGLKPGQYVYLEVSDSGCGLSEEVKQHMFDPFFTTKSTGRGLGMSAMLGIVRGHNGGLKIYSEQGRGTSVKVLLPQSDVVHKKEPVVEKVIEKQSGDGRLILVVDDEPMLRDVAKAMLKLIGFEVITASNGKECLEIYDQRGHEISAILLDMMMPQMNGEETFRALRERNPAVRVLLCSGYNEQDATQRFVGRGLAGFVQKPYTPQQLQEKMLGVLEG